MAAMAAASSSRILAKVTSDSKSSSSISSSSSSSSSSYSYLKDGKLDQFNRLRTPRAAREMALCILYAATTSRVHPFKVLDERLRAPREAVSREILDAYDHTAKDGEPLSLESQAKVRQAEEVQEETAAIDAAVLSANPYVVHNKFVLSLARKIIGATSARWDEQEPAISALLPPQWTDESGGRLLETILMHMSIAEIEIVGTSPNIVINEAVEISKRFCDGFAPRVLNGCLGNYFRSRQPAATLSPIARDLRAGLKSSLYQSMGSCNDDYLDC